MKYLKINQDNTKTDQELGKSTVINGIGYSNISHEILTSLGFYPCVYSVLQAGQVYQDPPTFDNDLQVWQFVPVFTINPETNQPFTSSEEFEQFHFKNRTLTRDEILDLFGAKFEQIAVAVSSPTHPLYAVWLKLTNYKYFKVTDPRVIAGFEALFQANLITLEELDLLKSGQGIPF